MQSSVSRCHHHHHRGVLVSVPPCSFLPSRGSGWRRRGGLSLSLSSRNRPGKVLNATSDKKALTDLSQAAGPPGVVGFGFTDQELARLRRHFEPIELAVVSGAPACRRGVTVGGAASLLQGRGGEGLEIDLDLDLSGEAFQCFSRVVLFCGLPGEVIEGLVEVWPVELCDSALISFSYLGASMVSADLEQWLLKVIKATDANEDDVSEETSKEQLRKMLDDMKAGGRRRGGGANDAPKEKKRGFGR